MKCLWKNIWDFNVFTIDLICYYDRISNSLDYFDDVLIFANFCFNLDNPQDLIMEEATKDMN